MKPHKYMPLEERLRTGCRVDSDSGCWVWERAVTNRGYGQLSVDGKLELAHRASFTHHKGPIPEGAFVLHKCNNSRCINPDHLYAGTHRDNMDDWIRDSTHCKRGHEFTEENTYLTPQGHRECRTCKSERRRAYREKTGK